MTWSTSQCSTIRPVSSKRKMSIPAYSRFPGQTWWQCRIVWLPSANARLNSTRFPGVVLGHAGPPTPVVDVGSQFRWHLARGMTSAFPPVSHSDRGRFVSWMASFPQRSDPAGHPPGGGPGAGYKRSIPIVRRMAVTLSSIYSVARSVRGYPASDTATITVPGVQLGSTMGPVSVLSCVTVTGQLRRLTVAARCV